MAKRFPFLSENKDYGLEDILTHAENNKNKVKTFQKVLESKEIIASNYDIMQLYTTVISPQGVRKLKYAIQNDGVDLNRTKIRTMLLKDGIGTLNIDELMLMLNSHKKINEGWPSHFPSNEVIVRNKEYKCPNNNTTHSVSSENPSKKN